MQRLMLHGSNIYGYSDKLTAVLAPARRGVVQGFSDRSAARLRRYLEAAEADYAGLLTLTVPSWAPGAGDPTRAKEWLWAFVGRLKRSPHWRLGASLCWAMELHKGGWFHFHCLLSFRVPKEWLSQAWYEVVGTEHPSHLAAGTRIETIRAPTGALRYMSKYLTKRGVALQKALAGHWCGRWWGVVGRRDTVEAALHCSQGQEGLLTAAAEAKVEELIQKGAGTRLDISKWDAPGLLWAVKVPDKGERRRFRAWMMALKYELCCALWAMDPLGGEDDPSGLGLPIAFHVEHDDADRDHL